MSSSYMNPGGKLVVGWRFKDDPKETTVAGRKAAQEKALKEAIEDRPDLVDLKTLAEMMGVVPQTLIDRINAGKLAAFRVKISGARIARKYQWKVSSSEIRRMRRMGELTDRRPVANSRRK